MDINCLEKKKQKWFFNYVIFNFIRHIIINFIKQMPCSLRLFDTENNENSTTANINVG